MDGTRINITLDKRTYDLLRALSFKRKRTMSALVRDGIGKIISDKSEKEADLILNAQDIKELLKITEDNDYVSEEEFNKEFGFKD